MDENVIKNMVKDLNGIFGQDGTMLEASYGKIHEYLGMTIDYSEENVVKFTMYDYLEDILAEDDYGKLKKLIEYLRESIYLPLILGWDESGILTWSVDASFAVHMDMRSHTGMALTLGRGALISGSYKQNINTKSSTESELVGVDDGMPFIMWIRLFYIEHNSARGKSKRGCTRRFATSKVHGVCTPAPVPCLTG
jgi:hypothetical protein